MKLYIAWINSFVNIYVYINLFYLYFDLLMIDLKFCGYESEVLKFFIFILVSKFWRSKVSIFSTKFCMPQPNPWHWELQIVENWGWSHWTCKFSRFFNIPLLMGFKSNLLNWEFQREEAVGWSHSCTLISIMNSLNCPIMYRPASCRRTRVTKLCK